MEKPRRLETYQKYLWNIFKWVVVVLMILSQLLSMAAITTNHNWVLKTTEFFSYIILESEVQNQGVSRTALPPGENPLSFPASGGYQHCFPWLVPPWPQSLSLSSYQLSPLSICSLYVSYKDTYPLIQDPPWQSRVILSQDPYLNCIYK